jgi:glycerol kinase
MPTHLIAIDQGTTSTRAIVFDARLAPVASAQQELRQIYPAPGWVEHDPEEIWASVVATVRGAMAKAGVAAKDVAAIGITNQRETTIVWDRESGKPIHNAIVWRRPPHRKPAPRCAPPATNPRSREKPASCSILFFPATKIGWPARIMSMARGGGDAGQARVRHGDTFRVAADHGVHATDGGPMPRARYCSTSARAMGPRVMPVRNSSPLLPVARDCAADFGETQPDLFGGAIAILGVAGDQQAATVGQGCFAPGMMKSTYGTGCFALLNTGAEAVRSRHRLLTTIAYQLSGKRTYALEGAIFIAGAAVQWLRDGLRIIGHASEVDALRAKADPAEQVYLVPAFVGLGAPYWDAQARGAIFGLTRNSGAAELARAALDAVGYQTRDLLEAMRADGRRRPTPLRRWRHDSERRRPVFADITNALGRPSGVMETTARVQPISPDTVLAAVRPGGFAKTWRLDVRFQPAMDAAARARKWAGWQAAIRRTRTAPA